MTDTCCEQPDVAALEARQRRVLGRVLVINVLTFLMMVAGSWLSGSSSLLSGTLDNFGDALTYTLSLFVVGASRTAKARVAFFKGLLILGAAAAVAAQIVWRLFNFDTPVAETMGVVAVLNLGANALCLWLLFPYRTSDINMASVWECSRNDVVEGFAVIAAALAVWLLDSGWPDIVVAVALLAFFTRSAAGVLRGAWHDLVPATDGRSP